MSPSPNYSNIPMAITRNMTLLSIPILIPISTTEETQPLTKAVLINKKSGPPP